jgi:hypothetical protein
MSTEQERQLRDAAFAARGELDESKTEAAEPARLSQMVSLRLDGEVASALRDLATERGCSISELLREAAALLLERAAEPAHTVVRFEVIRNDVASWTSSDFVTGWPASTPDDQDNLVPA